MHLQAAKRWRGALIILFSAATGLFATTDTLGPFIWSISSGNATVYADWVSTSVTVNSNPTIDGVALPYGSIIAAVDSFGNCIGAHKWESGSLSISVQGFDSTAGVVTHGLKSGQRYRFVLWDSVTGQQVSSVYKHFAAHGLFMGIDPNADSSYVANTVSWLDTLRGYSAPALTSPVNGAANQIVSPALSWMAVTNATSYAVLVSTNSNFSTTVLMQTGLTVPSWGVSGLTNSTTYYWQAANTTNPAGIGAWSSIWSFTTVVAAPAPPLLSAPASGSANQPVNLTLSWAAGSGAAPASYSIQVSTSAAFATTLFSQTGITTTSVAPSGLANGVTYYWWVNATNLGGTSAWSSIWNFGTIPLPPGAPALSGPANAATGQSTALTLSWAVASGVITSYTVQVSTVSTFANTTFAQTGAGLTAAATGLAYGGITYYWKVGATNAAATTWSGIWSFVTLAAPAVPTLVSPSNGAPEATGALLFTWAAASAAASYTVQIATVSTFSSTTVSQPGITATSVSLTPTVNKLSYWRVNATNPFTTSAWSTVWSFVSGTSVLHSPLVTGAYEFSMKQGAITYSLPKVELVDLSLYDLLGRAAMTFNSRQAAGSYSINLKSSFLATGEYIVRFKAGSFEKQSVMMFTR